MVSTVSKLKLKNIVFPRLVWNEPTLVCFCFLPFDLLMQKEEIRLNGCKVGDGEREREREREKEKKRVRGLDTERARYR